MERSFLLEENGLKIPVKITSPDGCTPRRVVLGVHGLGGSTEDLIQQSLAEEMGFFSAAMVRFDMPCHGTSPMTGKELRLHNCVGALLAVARLAKETFPDTQGLCIFATGFGAYVTLVALEDLMELEEDIRLVVQTPSVVMHQTLLNMMRLNHETLRSMEEYVLPAPRPLTITYELYNEMRQNIVLAPQPVPMLILHGEHDRYISMDHIQNFRRVNEGSKLVIIPGASHQFLEEGAWDMVLDLTRDWFEYRQVLLTDWE